VRYLVLKKGDVTVCKILQLSYCYLWWFHPSTQRELRSQKSKIIDLSVELQAFCSVRKEARSLPMNGIKSQTLLSQHCVTSFQDTQAKTDTEVMASKEFGCGGSCGSGGGYWGRFWGQGQWGKPLWDILAFGHSAYVTLLLLADVGRTCRLKDWCAHVLSHRDIPHFSQLPLTRIYSRSMKVIAGCSLQYNTQFALQNSEQCLQ
jgi:hypothetical protein